jgi:hypothetical protein
MAKAKNQPQQRREDPKPAPKPAPMPMSQAIRQAGEGGITKQEFKQITQDSGKSSGAVVQKLDQINKNLKQNDKAAIGLGAAASNMLIREASKQSPTGYDAYLSNIMGPAMGTGRFGTELQRRATEFGTDRNMSALVSGGQYMMPSGRTANLGFGPQYELPKTTIKNPIGGVEDVPSTTGGDTTTTTPEDIILPEKEEEPTQIVNLQDPFAVSGMATSWRRAGKGKGKGIRSTSAASRSARSMPSSKTLGI